jgi:hypothetical protein
MDIAQASMLQHSFMHAEIDMNVVSLARNNIVESLHSDIDVTFWVDSDVVIPPNSGELLNYLTDETPVVSGIYVSRRFPYFPQVYTKATVHKDGDHPYLPVLDIPDRPTLYDAVGAGFMMVKRWVFDKLAENSKRRDDNIKNWLAKYRGAQDTEQFIEVERALHLAMSLRPWFEFLGKVGEDFYFCERLAEIGIRPLVVPTVWARHIGRMEFGQEHYEQVKRQNLTYISTASGGRI